MNSVLETNRISRRAMIAGAATIPLFSGFVRRMVAAELGSAPGLVMREREPQNLESEFSALDNFITPNEQFYIRSHFAVPDVDTKTWQLRIEGAVAKPFQLSLDEFAKLPAETKAVTLECAGNGRVYLLPKADGVQWQTGAVGTAKWTGVKLSTLLERAGVDSSAVEVVLEGADSGEPSKPSKPGKPISFSRSLPLERAKSGDVLLAYRMNDQPLPKSHGFPVRAIVPGWYGMASVKWLRRIVVVKQPHQGYFQTVDYAHWKHEGDFTVRVPLGEIQVKSQIARPAIGEAVRKGATYRVFGAAWSGDAAITKVEVSTDGGEHFAEAKLLGDAVPHAWRLWEYSWRAPDKAGKHKLISKATDARGNSQPVERDKDRESYMINHLVPLEVEVT